MIDQCVPHAGPSPPAALLRINTPLVVREWQSQLSHHPDREYVQYIIDGISSGFRIGFDYTHHTCRSAQRNTLSATQHPEEVEVRLRSECELGRVIGPIEAGPVPVQVNRFGIIPKPHQPGKWRMIVDLSYPKGSSMNDVSREMCAHYHMHQLMML